MALEYEDKTKLIPEDCFLFSVTDISLFKNNPTEFFKKVLLKEATSEPNFHSLLGTCVHHLCSSFYDKSTTLSKVKDEIEEFITELNPLKIDKSLLFSKYMHMQEVVIDTLKQNNFNFGEPSEVEQSYVQKLTDKVYLGGTLDIRHNSLIIDYKTTTNKYVKPDMEFPERYSNQLYAYAWLCNRKGIKIDYLALQYFTQPETNRYSEVTMKPLKDYPCKDVLVMETLNEELLKDIEDTIFLIAETIEYILKNPDSFRYFARDLKLYLG